MTKSSRNLGLTYIGEFWAIFFKKKNAPKNIAKMAKFRPIFLHCSSTFYWCRGTGSIGYVTAWPVGILVVYVKPSDQTRL
jgi:hypothetical protein